MAYYSQVFTYQKKNKSIEQEPKGSCSYDALVKLVVFDHKAQLDVASEVPLDTASLSLDHLPVRATHVKALFRSNDWNDRAFLWFMLANRKDLVRHRRSLEQLALRWLQCRCRGVS